MITTQTSKEQFVRQFILAHIKANGETSDLFFRHLISHKYPEITQDDVRRAIGVMTRLNKPLLRVTRQQVIEGERIKFLALAEVTHSRRRRASAID